jgi:hypothetical protein
MGLISDVVGGITGSDASRAIGRGADQLSAAATEGGDIRSGGFDILSQGALDSADILSKGLLKGGKLRAKGGRKALGFLEDQLSPFAGAFGQDDIAGINALATDPTAQMNFLQNNPLFEALKNQSREATFRTQSAGGALGSSGTDLALQNAFLSQGNDLINQQINRQLPLLQGAQSASTNLGTGGANLLTKIANAKASGVEGSAEALGQGRLNSASALMGGQNALAEAIEAAAQAQATGGIGQANAKAQGAQNIIGGLGALGGQGTGEDGSGGFSIATLGAALGLSDKALKTNIKKLGTHQGLDTYSWTWNSEANDLGLNGDSYGHIAQEVQKVHPELVEMTDCGYLAINYGTDKTVNI